MAAKRKKTTTKKTSKTSKKTKKTAAKKTTAKKKATPKKVAKPAKSLKKKVSTKASAARASTKKKSPTASTAKAKTPNKAESKAAQEKEERRNKAAQAMKAALDETESTTDEEEFDPEAFFAASGGKGVFRAHVMRKERVDLNIPIRYRKEKDPIVHNAELINLSKGGLCLRIDEVLAEESTLRIEIPLPHTSELFRVQTKIVWSHRMEGEGSEIDQPIHAGMTFLPMSLAKQTVINNFIQQRRDELIMAKIGLDKFTDSVPVAGLD